jgi:hypothetical protein
MKKGNILTLSRSVGAILEIAKANMRERIAEYRASGNLQAELLVNAMEFYLNLEEEKKFITFFLETGDYLDENGNLPGELKERIQNAVKLINSAPFIWGS